MRCRILLILITTTAMAGQLHLPRIVYPYSVVPGGITATPDLSQAELRAGLYYLQYRKDDQTGWTKTPRLIRAGEPVLVDQKGSILRVRCGNGISKAPRLPLVTFVPPTPQQEIVAAPTIFEPDVVAFIPEPSPVLASAELPPYEDEVGPLPVAHRPVYAPAVTAARRVTGFQPATWIGPIRIQRLYAPPVRSSIPEPGTFVLMVGAAVWGFGRKGKRC